MKIKEKDVCGRRRRCEEGASVEEGSDGRRSYCRQNTFLEEKPSLEVIRNKGDVRCSDYLLPPSIAQKPGIINHHSC